MSPLILLSLLFRFSYCSWWVISEEEEDISEIVMVKYSTLGVVELIVVGVVGVIEKDTVPIERIWNE